MKIDLDPSSAANLSELAVELLSHLERIPWPRPKSDLFRPDTHIQDVFKLESPTTLRLGETTNRYTGEVVELVLPMNREVAFRLPTEACRSLRDLANRVANSRPMKNIISEDTVKDHLIDWLRDSIKCGVQVDFMDYFIAAVEPTIKEAEMWVPIFGLHVESPLPFGKVIFRSITEKMLNEWYDRLKPAVEVSQRAAFEEEHRRKCSNCQGLAAATMRIVAEPKQAVKAALEIADHAVSLLRVLCIENIDPRAVSFCRPIGMEARDTYEVWEVTSGNSIQHTIESLMSPSPVPWVISNERLRDLKRFRFDALSRIAKGNNLTSYERDLEGALLIYSRSSLAKSPAEKLMFILIALESMLLRDQGESIQQNVGERIAFIIEKDPAKRQGVVRLFKNCYGLRSRFVHHGHALKDIDQLKDMMMKVYFLVTKLLGMCGDFKSKKELLDNLEAIKFS